MVFWGVCYLLIDGSYNVGILREPNFVARRKLRDKWKTVWTSRETRRIWWLKQRKDLLIVWMSHTCRVTSRAVGWSLTSAVKYWSMCFGYRRRSNGSSHHHPCSYSPRVKIRLRSRFIIGSVNRCNFDIYFTIVVKYLLMYWAGKYLRSILRKSWSKQTSLKTYV